MDNQIKYRLVAISISNDNFCGSKCQSLCLGICLIENKELETFGLRYVRSERCLKETKKE